MLAAELDCGEWPELVKSRSSGNAKLGLALQRSATRFDTKVLLSVLEGPIESKNGYHGSYTMYIYIDECDTFASGAVESHHPCRAVKRS